jgi:RHS repeat-associated protein
MLPPLSVLLPTIAPNTTWDYRMARYYDADIGRFLGVDQLAVQAPGWSSYRYAFDNPVLFVDLNGLFESTGVRKNKDGSYTVIGARPDGNTGIYLVDENDNWDVNTSQSIGYKTLNHFDFCVPNDRTGGYTEDPVDVTFSIEKLRDGNAIFKFYTSVWKSFVQQQSTPLSVTLMPVLAWTSRNGAFFDIKENYPKTSGGIYTPVLLDNNTITTVRSLGNVIFGNNMRTVYDKSWSAFLDTPSSFYCLNMPFVGLYNQIKNGGNGYNMGYPFFGEHTYSGTNIYNGFFNKKPQ